MTRREDFDYESVTWGGGDCIVPGARDFLDHSLHLRYALDALDGVTGKVIEIGCGSGRFIASVAAARPDLEAHGSDISETALTEAKKRQHVEFKLADALKLPYPTDTFDAVLMLDVLEHLPNIEQALSEVRRVLKNDGVFHLVFPCEGHRLTLHGLVDSLHALKRKHAGHIQRLDPKALHVALKKNQLVPSAQFYSYHLLGQLYDAAVWSAVEMGALSHAARHALVDQNTSGKTSVLAPLVRGVRTLLSTALYYEATLLRHMPFGMTVHVTCR